MKPGYKTSEFWLAFILDTFQVAVPLLGGPIGLPGLASAAYAISRGLAKGGLIRGWLGSELLREQQGGGSR